MIVKLTDEKYRELKRELYVKQRGRCAHCGKSKPLDLAHKRARGSGGGWREDTEKNGHLLCRDCHVKAGYEISKFGSGLKACCRKRIKNERTNHHTRRSME